MIKYNCIKNYTKNTNSSKKIIRMILNRQKNCKYIKKNICNKNNKMKVSYNKKLILKIK